MPHYTLTDFFKDYMFKGLIQLPRAESNEFELEVFQYDPRTGLFIASGRDIRGLSGIFGEIRSETETSARVRFRQSFSLTRSFNIEATLRKTSENVFLQGIYQYPRDPLVYQVTMSVAPKGSEALAGPGWMEKALTVELP